MRKRCWATYVQGTHFGDGSIRCDAFGERYMLSFAAALDLVEDLQRALEAAKKQEPRALAWHVSKKVAP